MYWFGRLASAIFQILMNIHTALMEIDMFQHVTRFPQNNKTMYCTSIEMEKCNVRIYKNKFNIAKLGTNKYNSKLNKQRA